MKYLVSISVVIAAVLLMMIFLNACNYSVVLNHTEGSASDLVDDTDSLDVEANPNVSVVPA